MQHKRLVVDANILIRAVFGQRVRQLIADASEHVAFYVAEANYQKQWGQLRLLCHKALHTPCKCCLRPRRA